MRVFAVLLGVCAVAGCATPSATRSAAGPEKSGGEEEWARWPKNPPEPEEDAEQRLSRGERIARTVRRWVGLKSLRSLSNRVPDDCSGLVRLAYGRYGLNPLARGRAPGGSAVKGMYLRAKRAGALRRRHPRPGDLVFFHNTYDRNRDRKRNDGITHVGVVEEVEPNGTVVFVHRGSQGVARARMNTARPGRRKGPRGHILNDYLRRPDRTRAPRLAGQLFAGYASPEAFQTAVSSRR